MISCCFLIGSWDVIACFTSLHREVNNLGSHLVVRIYISALTLWEYNLDLYMCASGM